MMVKDKRYIIVKNLIESGHFTEFRNIFDILPKSVIYKELGMNNTRFTHLIENVEFFVLNDLFRIAELFDVDKKKLLDLAFKQYENDHKLATKKKRG